MFFPTDLLDHERWSHHVCEMRGPDSLELVKNGYFTLSPIGSATPIWTIGGLSPGENGVTILRGGAVFCGGTVQASGRLVSFLTQTVRKELFVSTRCKVEKLENQHFFVGISTAQLATKPLLDAQGNLGGLVRAGFHHRAGDGAFVHLDTRYSKGFSQRTHGAFEMENDKMVTLGIHVVENPPSSTEVFYWMKENGRDANGAPHEWELLAIHNSSDANDRFNGALVFSFANVSVKTPAMDLFWMDYFTWTTTRDLEG